MSSVDIRILLFGFPLHITEHISTRLIYGTVEFVLSKKLRADFRKYLSLTIQQVISQQSISSSASIHFVPNL